MPTQIDAASEFAQLCEALAISSRDNGAKTLARQFNVKNGSVEFYRLLSCIQERIDNLVAFIEAVPTLQADYKQALVARVNNLRQAFSTESLYRAWNEGGGGASFLTDGNIFPLKVVSGEISRFALYSKLTDDEVASVLDHIRELQEWLTTQELSENDFIRQLILEGLHTFQFRLEKLKWVGVGFALESFKDVIAAYLILEGKEPTAADSPDAKAVMMKVGTAIKQISSAIGLVKDGTEKGQFMLSALQACTEAAKSPVVAGLLGFATGSSVP